MTCSLTKSSVQIYSSDDKHLVVGSFSELGVSNIFQFEIRQLELGLRCLTVSFTGLRSCSWVVEAWPLQLGKCGFFFQKTIMYPFSECYGNLNIFASDCSSLSPFLTQIVRLCCHFFVSSVWEAWPFSLLYLHCLNLLFLLQIIHVCCHFFVSSVWEAWPFSLSYLHYLNLLCLLQIIRVCCHFFRIFSLGSVALFFVVFTLFEFVVQFGKRGPFLCRIYIVWICCFYFRSFVFVAIFFVSSVWEAWPFSLSYLRCLNLLFLLQIIRVCCHFFRIFSLGSMALFFVVFTLFEFFVFTSDHSCLLPFFSYLQFGKRGPFLCRIYIVWICCFYFRSFVFVAIFFVSSVWEAWPFSLSYLRCLNLLFLLQIIRVCCHFFRIFSWGSLAFFSSPLQRALR